jgi:predicted SnoaL-like aldol condensation-catalyzing enzyme
VLEAFDTLFNKPDYDAASRFWSDKYVQHSAHIEPGREGLFGLIRSLPDSLRYDLGFILAEGDYVIIHSRFSGNGRSAAWVARSRGEFGPARAAGSIAPCLFR